MNHLSQIHGGYITCLPSQHRYSFSGGGNIVFPRAITYLNFPLCMLFLTPNQVSFLSSFSDLPSSLRMLRPPFSFRATPNGCMGRFSLAIPKIRWFIYHQGVKKERADLNFGVHLRRLQATILNFVTYSWRASSFSYLTIIKYIDDLADFLAEVNCQMKTSYNSSKEPIEPDDSCLNHCWVAPTKVVEKTQHFTPS